MPLKAAPADTAPADAIAATPADTSPAAVAPAELSDAGPPEDPPVDPPPVMVNIRCIKASPWGHEGMERDAPADWVQRGIDAGEIELITPA